ncbi:hypothetical protein [Burkholderia gladioli]|nr:hypothetical protein [Burkholderia gladioli]
MNTAKNSFTVDAITERATIAAGKWADPDTPFSEALAYRDGFIDGYKVDNKVPNLSVDEICAVWDSMPNSDGGFMKEWGYYQFALAVLEAARSKVSQ